MPSGPRARFAAAPTGWGSGDPAVAFDFPCLSCFHPHGAPPDCRYMCKLLEPNGGRAAEAKRLLRDCRSAREARSSEGAAARPSVIGCGPTPSAKTRRRGTRHPLRPSSGGLGALPNLCVICPADPAHASSWPQSWPPPRVLFVDAARLMGGALRRWVGRLSPLLPVRSSGQP